MLSTISNYVKYHSIIKNETRDISSKHVAVVYGGMSLEREVSISSSSAIIESIVDLGYQVTSIDMGADISSVLQKIKPDVVFNALHGTYGEDGCLQGILNVLNIPYTHSGLMASSLSMNKKTSLDFFSYHKILSAKRTIVKKSDNIDSDPMPRPYVVKPIAQGSSIGVNIVFEEDDFDFKNYKYEYGDEILVEEYINGKEIQVAVLNGKALGALELKILSERYYTYDVKYTQGLADHIYPARLSEDNYRKILAISEKIYNLLGYRGLIRIEFIYCEQRDNFFMLEVNTHPGMTALSICPEIAQHNGISFTQLVKILLDSAQVD